MNNILNLYRDFCGHFNIKKLKNVEERILFVLYISEKKFELDKLTTKQIYEIINNRLRKKTSMQAINMAIIRSGNKISSIKQKGVKYHKIMSDGIDKITKLLEVEEPKEVIDLIIPNEVIEKERDYFKNVVKQINGCYQDRYYDACFVMIRRATETLIIDVFEFMNIEEDIKENNGDYLPFSKLIDKTLSQKKIRLSKIAKKDLKIIKKFGDTAAHNRRLNLKKPDIDKYSASIRLIVEELINHKN